MQSLLSVLCAAIPLLAGPGPAADYHGESEFIRVRYEVYGDYAVSTRFEPDAQASFLVMKDQQSFDRVFSPAEVMGETPNRLESGAFDSKRVIAVIKRGNLLWGYRVEDVSSENETLFVRYDVTLKEGGPVIVASPLIISVPRRDYSNVVFVEDGKTVKKLKLKR